MTARGRSCRTSGTVRSSVCTSLPECLRSDALHPLDFCIPAQVDTPLATVDQPLTRGLYERFGAISRTQSAVELTQVAVHGALRVADYLRQLRHRLSSSQEANPPHLIVAQNGRVRGEAWVCGQRPRDLAREQRPSSDRRMEDPDDLRQRSIARNCGCGATLERLAVAVGTRRVKHGDDDHPRSCLPKPGYELALIGGEGCQDRASAFAPGPGMEILRLSDPEASLVQGRRHPTAVCGALIEDDDFGCGVWRTFDGA